MPTSPPDQGFPTCPPPQVWFQLARGQGSSGEQRCPLLCLKTGRKVLSCLSLCLPRKTVPKGRWQNWGSKAMATPSISPLPISGVPIQGDRDRDGDRAILGRRGGSPTAKGWETQSSALLPNLPGEDPEQPLSFLPARKFNVRPSCKRSPGLQFPAPGDLPDNLLPFPWEINEKADLVTEGTGVCCSPSSAASPPSYQHPWGCSHHPWDAGYQKSMGRTTEMTPHRLTTTAANAKARQISGCPLSRNMSPMRTSR